MKLALLGLLAILTACDERSPLSSQEPETPRDSVVVRVTPDTEVEDSVWRRAEQEILQEIDRRGWELVRNPDCLEQLSWYSQWVGSGWEKSAKSAVTGWEEVQSEGDPETFCVITPDNAALAY